MSPYGEDGAVFRIAESRQAGYCLCLVPGRQMVDCRGIRCAPCQQMITDQSPPYDRMESKT